METSNYTFYEQTIIENIDFDGYGYANDCYLYDKIKTLYNIFKSEYGFMIDRVGNVNAFKEWLMGLPSVLTVPYWNHEILENARKSGIEIDERFEDGFLDRYWLRLAEAFFTLKDNL